MNRQVDKPAAKLFIFKSCSYFWQLLLYIETPAIVAWFSDSLSDEQKDQCATKNTTRFAGGSLFLARLERFELPASWFVAKHSIQLSYRRLQLTLYNINFC